MSKVIKINQIPEKSIIQKNFGKIDFCDAYKFQLKATDYSVDKVTTAIFKIPKWVDNLMRLRDLFVQVFGLKSGTKEDIKIEPYYSIGSKAIYFTVSDRNKNEIVMAENDKHLNFRTSVMIEKDDINTTVFFSTIVHFNNIFGRLYFLPVKPFHTTITKSLLKRCANEMSMVRRNTNGNE